MQKREHTDYADAPEPQGLQETDVFITEYLNKSTSFTAIIKQRFSDFQVFEINDRGSIVHLTSLENNFAESKTEADGSIKFPDLDVNVDDIPVKELIYPLSSDSQWKQLTLLMKRRKKDETIRIEVTDVDKTERTTIHTSISNRFEGALSSRTVEEAGNKKYIVIGTCKSVDKRNLWTWPRDLPQYLHFVVYKENIDTINAVRTMCKILRISQNSVSYAGTKDRRGVTTQRMCIRRMCAKRVHALSQKRLWCGNFEYKDEPLRLGQLKGNRFVIALRNVESSSENVNETLKMFEKLGFINYYGLQRFGSYSQAPTYEIGRNLICSQWSQAVNLILKPRTSDKQSDLQQACKIWAETGDAKAALKSLRYDHTAEGIVLKTLSQQGNTAYVNALQKVPRNILLLYVHSFQSVVWNRVVSKRLKQHGLKVLPGDLVYVGDVNDVVDMSDVEEFEENQTCSKSVRSITTDEIDKVSIYDIVYPLPGHSIKYPENETAKWYQEVLHEYGVADFNGKNKMFTASGDYRKLLVLPENVEWKTVFYENPSADVIATDLQKLKNEKTVENLEAGSYKAVILEFSLPACTYATMALREITKMDTSSSHQASLSFTHLQTKKPKLSE